jgi:hypothetical protein
LSDCTDANFLRLDRAGENDLFTGYANLPGRRVQKTTDDIDQCALARAIFSH